MGTNFYAVLNRPTVRRPIHIGKRSAGWLFNFESYNEPYDDPPLVWNTYDQVKSWLQEYVSEKSEYVIMDEYDRILTVTEFLDMVEAIQNDPNCLKNRDNFTYSRNVNGYRFSDQDFC